MNMLTVLSISLCLWGALSVPLPTVFEIDSTLDITEINKGLELNEGDIVEEDQRSSILDGDQWSSPVLYKLDAGLGMAYNFDKYGGRIPPDSNKKIPIPKIPGDDSNKKIPIPKLPPRHLDMSPYDAEEVNRLYKCTDSISFLEHCSFDDKGMCDMNSSGWERVNGADGGPHSDHTHLDTASQGSFMYFSTSHHSGEESAHMISRRMTPRRSCKVQCLEFFYYHTGNETDQLSIWIREFDGDSDATGTRRLMGQISGSPAYYWQLHHVPLNATKTFQVEFEGRKGAGSSGGGFSVDDINLSETECPHHTWHIRNFSKVLNNSAQSPFLFSPKYYSIDGYRFQIMLQMMEDHFGAYVRLVSGSNDDNLQWPCPWRQVTIQALDQNAHIQHRMSAQISLTTDPTQPGQRGSFWGNPREVGVSDEGPGGDYVTDGWGFGDFMSNKELRSREFLKGGDLFLLITMQDISPLTQGSALPCPTSAAA